MRLQDVIRMAGDYLSLGVVILAAALVVFCVGYLGIYKGICRGKRHIDFKKLFWWIIFVFYVFVVLAITLFRPSGVWNGQIISFFYSYKEAWISGSAREWRNIILNILMFVPLGFWLPLGLKRFRVFWKTYLVGFLLTAGIEFFQLIFSLGIFEVADLFNNTLGTMIGYGSYKIVEYIVQLFKKKKILSVPVFACQLPLILTICMFTIIFSAYAKQELGNLSIECIQPYSKDTFQIVSTEEYSEESETAMVYQTNIMTEEETEAFARNFVEKSGTTLDENRTDIYDDTAVYWAEERYSIWIDFNGGTYRITDYDTLFAEDGKEEPQKVTDATEDTMLELLLEYGIELPEGINFSGNSDGSYTFTADKIKENECLYDGKLTCDYYDNERFSEVRNSIIRYKVYKEFEMLSEQEAYEQILDGKFVSFIDVGEKIEVGWITLDYMLDTKGFYQPIYNFEVFVDGEENCIQIPAIK